MFPSHDRGSITGESDGTFHIVVPGDPFQHPFPILTQNSSYNDGEWLSKKCLVLQTPKANDTSLNQSYAPGATVQTTVGVVDGSAIKQDEWLDVLCEMMQNVHDAVEAILPTWHSQMWAVMTGVSTYRIVAQGMRLWSIQGTNNQQGIVRVAEIDPISWRANTKKRIVTGKHLAVPRW